MHDYIAIPWWVVACMKGNPHFIWHRFQICTRPVRAAACPKHGRPFTVSIVYPYKICVIWATATARGWYQIHHKGFPSYLQISLINCRIITSSVTLSCWLTHLYLSPLFSLHKPSALNICWVWCWVVRAGDNVDLALEDTATVRHCITEVEAFVTNDIVGPVHSSCRPVWASNNCGSLYSTAYFYHCPLVLWNRASCWWNCGKYVVNYSACQSNMKA